MLAIKQGEAKSLTITVTGDYGAAVDISGTTLALGVKLNKNQATCVIEKADTDFDKTLAAQGVISVFLTTTDTNITPGNYVGELSVTWAGLPQEIIENAEVRRVYLGDEFKM